MALGFTVMTLFMVLFFVSLSQGLMCVRALTHCVAQVGLELLVLLLILSKFWDYRGVPQCLTALSQSDFSQDLSKHSPSETIIDQKSIYRHR